MTEETNRAGSRRGLSGGSSWARRLRRRRRALGGLWSDDEGPRDTAAEAGRGVTTRQHRQAVIRPRR